MREEDEKELAQDEKEFTIDSTQTQKLASEQAELVPYHPKSAASFTVDALTPRNISFEVQKALNKVVLEKGNIDNYVRNSLKYVSTETLWKSLGKEQIDGVGLYLKQFEAGKGIIIGDQTGIGKGRQAAAVIRHAVKNGYLPIFFTKSPNLFTDIYRDLKDIGMKDINPFIVNTNDKSKIREEDKDKNVHIVFSPLSPNEQFELLTTQKTYPTDSKEVIDWHRENGQKFPDPKLTPEFTIIDAIDYLPIDYDMVFCTYSQVQSAHPFKRDWIKKLCDKGLEGSVKHKKVVFILDECHLAGGYDSIIGKWMRKVIPKTKASCFLSATFAKYPEVMPLYAQKTALSETGKEDEDLVEAMKKGGLALQEIIAPNLSESGQLINRQRSNEGVVIEYLTLNQEPERSVNRQRINSIIRIMRRIVDFEREFLEPIFEEIHKQAKENDDYIRKIKNLGVKQAPFFSRVFSIIDQMLFALKVEAVAKNALELLHADKKVVIAFKSTMGTFLKDMQLSSGDILPTKDLDFIATLSKGLDSVFNYSYTDKDNDKSKRRISIDELTIRGRKEYNAIKKAIRLERSNLSISPIDVLIDRIERQEKPEHLGGHDGSHFKVAEVTGRSQRLQFEEDTAVVSSFRRDTEEAFRLFNNGDYDVLLINQSGSTGASAHSSETVTDQRQRWMLIHQFELDINIEVQKRGRINRTGQVNKPGYRYIISDIPSEVRLINFLKSKLKSLDANTTGSQNTNEETLKSVDFFNKYGNRIAKQWAKENEDIARKLAVNEQFVTIKQVTGRAGLLLVEEQEELYNDLLLRYNKEIETEKQQGTYDLELEFLPLDAEIKKRFLYAQGNGGITPFGKDVVRELTIVNNLKRPFTKNEIDERVLEALDGKNAIQVKDALKIEVEREYPKLIEKRKQKKQESLINAQKDLEALPELDSGSTEEENEEIAFDRERIEEIIQNLTFEQLQIEKDLEYTQTQILRYIGYFHIGQLLKIPYFDSLREPSWGIFLGVSIGRGAKNPYTLSNIYLKFAVADYRRYFSFNLTPEYISLISTIYTETNEITEQDKEQIPQQWNEIIKAISAKREKRQILTQNILAAANQLGAKNKLIKYNTKQGTIRNGILMARSDGKEKHFALVFISKGIKALKSLKADATFKDHRGEVRFKKISDTHLQVLIKKKQQYKMSIDPRLRVLLLKQDGQSADELPNFVQNGNDMVGILPLSNLEPFVLILDEYTVQIEGKAEELKDWEIENQKDWADRTLKSDKRYYYELSKPYGQGSNPTAGFIDYIEPKESKHPFGEVVFDRTLNNKERYNYSLIPVFKSPEIPYKAWKKSIIESSLYEEFKTLVNQTQTEPLHDAIQKLGYFIINNAHEDGNREFVFGRYTPTDLGSIAYEDMISLILPIDILKNQLQLIQLAA